MSYIGASPTNTAFVTDTFSGNGSTTAFTTSVAPASTSSILVSVTGVLQDPSTYSVSGTTLTFSAAPPSGTGNISVRYLGVPASGVTTTAYRTVTEFTATAGQTSFSVPSYTVGYINVYRNGALLGTADYTATTGTTVVLGVGATVGDLIAVESFYVSSVLNAIPATAGAVNSTYIANGAVGSSALASGAALANIGSGGITQSYLATGVAGTGPAFSAYLPTNQTVSSGTPTKITLSTEEFDTASCYDNSTNYRFTPNVAGYYQVEFCVGGNSSSVALVASIYKNGSSWKQAIWAAPSTTGVSISMPVVALMYMNGSTDYIEFYGQTNGGTVIQSGQNYTYAMATLVRAA